MPVPLLAVHDLADLPKVYREPWLLEHIWTRNGFNLLVGAPKSRKSTLRRYLTACTLAHAPAFGRFCCRDTVKRVLVVFGEGQVAAEGALQHRACDALKLVERPIALTKPIPFHLENPQHFVELQALIAGEGFDLVIFDPLPYFHGQDENDALGMGRVCRALIELAEHAAVVVVHHTAKAMAGTPDRPVSHRGRGSSTLGGAADTILELSRTGPSQHALEFSTRGAEEPEKLFLEYDPLTGIWGIDREPLDKLIFAQLKGGERISGAELSRQIGRRKGDVLNRLKTLVGTGELESAPIESGHGNLYFLASGDGSHFAEQPEPSTVK